jgi:hypothetical protein
VRRIQAIRFGFVIDCFACDLSDAICDTNDSSVTPDAPALVSDAIVSAHQHEQQTPHEKNGDDGDDDGMILHPGSHFGEVCQPLFLIFYLVFPLCAFELESTIVIFVIRSCVLGSDCFARRGEQAHGNCHC